MRTPSPARSSSVMVPFRRWRVAATAHHVDGRITHTSCMGRVVTISASYGAGGSYVGPRVAERLGVPFVDRAIPGEVAQRLAVPLHEAVKRDESAGTVLERFVRALAPAGLPFGARPVLEHECVDDNAYRDATEQVIREQAASTGSVILGRAAALVLREHPGALHVRLLGPKAQRVERAMAAEGIDRAGGRAPARRQRPRPRGLRAALLRRQRARPAPLPPQPRQHCDRSRLLRRHDRHSGNALTVHTRDPRPDTVARCDASSSWQARSRWQEPSHRRRAHITSPTSLTRW